MVVSEGTDPGILLSQKYDLRKKGLVSHFLATKIIKEGTVDRRACIATLMVSNFGFGGIYCALTQQRSYYRTKSYTGMKSEKKSNETHVGMKVKFWSNFMPS